MTEERAPLFNWPKALPSKIDIRGPTECWEWKGATNAQGYGRFRLDGKLLLPHRLVYELTNGFIPYRKIILHACDNPRCCNPAHLKAGTYSDNVQDMLIKGRSGNKLAPHNEAMREIIINDPRSVRCLSQDLGIPQTTIARIRRKAGRKPNEHVHRIRKAAGAA